MTQYLGFPHYGDEYKVMGLAPYGEPRLLARMRGIVQLQDDGGFRLNLDYFRHVREKVEYTWDNGVPTVGRLYTDALEGLLGPARRQDEPLHRNTTILHARYRPCMRRRFSTCSIRSMVVTTCRR